MTGPVGGNARPGAGFLPRRITGEEQRGPPTWPLGGLPPGRPSRLPGLPGSAPCVALRWIPSPRDPTTPTNTPSVRLGAPESWQILGLPPEMELPHPSPVTDASASCPQTNGSADPPSAPMTAVRPAKAPGAGGFRRGHSALPRAARPKATETPRVPRAASCISLDTRSFFFLRGPRNSVIATDFD